MVATFILDNKFICLDEYSNIMVNEQLINRLFKENVQLDSYRTYNSINIIDNIDYEIHKKSFLNTDNKNSKISNLENTINSVLILDTDAKVKNILNKFRDVLRKKYNWEKLSLIEKFFFIYLISLHTQSFSSCLHITNANVIKQKFYTELDNIKAYDPKSKICAKLQLYLLIVHYNCY